MCCIHAIFAEHTLTGLQLAAQVALTGRSLKDLATVMTKLPQILINVRGVDRSRVNGDEVLAVALAEAELGDTPAACSCAPPAPNR